MEGTVAVARHAMATRFEVLLHGGDPVSLRAAAEEALDEIERLEAQLSLFRPASEISHVNRQAAHEPVRVSPPVFRLLEHARRLCAETQGAFDPTVAPLLECWGFLGGGGHPADPQALAQARARVGMQFVDLDPDGFRVRFQRPGMRLDLGAIGKGYAVDRAMDVLREAGVTCALLHGGTSSIYALGTAPGARVWKTAIPRIEAHLPGRVAGEPPGTPPVLAAVPLQDESLGVSAVWGKCFQSGGRTLGHVIDPRSGEPVQRAWLAAVILPSATETDALSTALLTLGPEGFEAIAGLRPYLRALLVAPGANSDAPCYLTRGLEILPGNTP